MKTTNFAWNLLVIFIVLLFGTVIFNVQNTVRAREQEDTFLEYLGNYLGKDVEVSGRTYVVRKVGSDYLVLGSEKEDTQVVLLQAIVAIDLPHDPSRPPTPSIILSSTLSHQKGLIDKISFLLQ